MSRKRVCIDACVFVALYQPGKYPSEVITGIKSLLAEIEKGQIVGVVSSFILTELLDGSLELLEAAFDNRKGFLVDVDPPIAQLARKVRTKILRHEKTLEAPDCVYLATAIIHDCEALVTIDGLSIKGGKVEGVSAKHRLLSAAEDIKKEFGLVVCTPGEVVNQLVMNYD